MAVLEREAELAALEAALASARDGRGSTIAIVGPPGIGKTTLLAALQARATIRALIASGAHGEATIPYGVIRQLFETAIAGLSASERERVLAGAAAPAAAIVDPRAELPRAFDPAALPHALYWLVANLASAPLLIVVDDAHWSDPASLGALAYLARRIDELPIALVLAHRTAEPAIDLAALHRIGATRTLVPAPLSEPAIVALGASPGHAPAIHASTGGIPLYVREALRDPNAVATLGERVVERVRKIGDAAVAVARAISILEPNAALAHVVVLAEQDLAVVAATVDELARLELLAAIAPCRFAHPIVRAAIEDSIPPAARGQLHARAAGCLRGAGAGLPIVASHLVRSVPTGDTATVAGLRAAASEAMARGAADEAIAYLVRALDEPPIAATRFELLMELAAAEGIARRPSHLDRLHEAATIAPDPAARAKVATALGRALWFRGQLDRAFQVLAQVTDADPEQALDRDAMLLAIALPTGRLVETAAIADARRAQAPTSAAARRVLGTIAFRAAITGEPKADVQALLERSLDDGQLALEPAGETPALVFAWLDELVRADHLLSTAIDEALARGSFEVASTYLASRAFVAVRRGNLARAFADLAHARAASTNDTGFSAIAALVGGVHAHVEAGDPDAAIALARSLEIPPPIARMPLVALVRHAEGLALHASHRYPEAIETLSRAGETFLGSGIVAPTVASWRSDLALAHAACGELDRARELIADELVLAERTGVARARARALRAGGLVDDDRDRLAAAVAVLADGPGRLDLARTRCDLGAALRRDNQRREAREHLQAALDLAQLCGARALAERAWAELGASGAKPRRPSFSGVDALTGAELRVCQLAATGCTNAEIAQRLVVTKKTVETHLGNAYKKLEIDGRDQLAAALAQKMPTPGARM